MEGVEGVEEAAVTEVEAVDGGVDEELGVVGIAKAGTTKGPSRPLQRPTRNRRATRGNGLSNQTEHRIQACGDRPSLLSRARKKSRQTETKRRHSDV